MNVKTKFILYIIASILSSTVLIGSVVMFFTHNSVIWSITLTMALIISVVLIGIFSTQSIKSFICMQSNIKSSYSKYVDEILKHNNVGMLVFDTGGNIIHTTNFIRERFGKKLVGTRLSEFFKTLKITIESRTKEYEFMYENNTYLLKYLELDNYLSIKDISLETKALQLYDDELPVLGQLEIDNLDLYQSTLTNDEFYNLNKGIIELLDSLVEKYNFVYRQNITEGHFLILMNKKTLNELMELKFEFFNSLHDMLKTTNNNIIVSVSAGFAYGVNDLSIKANLAKEALLHARRRGGDQVVVMSPYEPTRYFGSTTEILPSLDRTQIRTFANILEKKMLDKSISNVIIYGHSVADLDAIGAAMGVYALASHYGKNAYICSITQDETTKKVLAQYWDVIKNRFIRPQQANKLSNESTIVFFVDNSHPSRTDNPDAIKKVKSENIFILDHHRVKLSIDFAPKQNRIVTTSASSASELVTELLIFAKQNINIELITAQLLLNGICLDTLQFQKQVTSKTFEAASWLEQKGANSSTAANALKIDSQTQQVVNKLLKNLQEIKPGFFLAYSDISVSDDLISIAAEEVLRIDGRRASFVVARQDKSQKLKLSARGIETNVQIICENVGGGGGFSAAAAVSNEDLETFISNIKQAIVGAK